MGISHTAICDMWLYNPPINLFADTCYLTSPSPPPLCHSLITPSCYNLLWPVMTCNNPYIILYQPCAGACGGFLSPPLVCIKSFSTTSSSFPATSARPPCRSPRTSEPCTRPVSLPWGQCWPSPSPSRAIRRILSRAPARRYPSPFV